MSNESIVKLDSALPDSVPQAIRQIRMLDQSLEMVSSISYWAAGRILNHMKRDLAVKNPAKVAAQQIGQSERLMTYCLTVFGAFTPDQVQALAGKGLRWSVMRDLASSRVDLHREHLIGLFLDETITAEELHIEVRKLQSKGRGPVTQAEEEAGEDDLDPEEDEHQTLVLKLKKLMGDIRVCASKLNKECPKAVIEMRGGGEGLSDALIQPDGSRDTDAEDIVREMASALQKAMVESAELLFRSSMSIMVCDWPFAELDEKLDEFRDLYDDAGIMLEGDG